MAKSMFSVTSDIKSWTKKMNRVNKELLPQAIGATINTAAKGAHARGLKNIKKDLILRNPYTEKSLKLWQSKYKPGRSIDRINAVTGTISSYLPIQEEGGTVQAKSNRLPIPTLAGRRGRWDRPIPPSLRMNRMGEIGTEGSKFFFMSSRGGKKGIFYRRTKKKIEKVRDISKRFIRIKPTRWHSKAVEYFSRPEVFGRIFIHHAKRFLGKIK